MNRKNNILMTILIVMTALFSGSAVAELQKDARTCIRPKFSKFTPSHLTEVAPGATISFVTNHTTSKYTIKVKVKGIEIDRKALRITDKKSFYFVEFELPESLQNTYARIHLFAKAKVAPKRCEHKDGWLLKIGGDGNATTEAEAKPVAKVASDDAATVQPETLKSDQTIDAPKAKSEQKGSVEDSVE